MEIEPIGPVAMAVYKSVKLKLQFFTEISNKNRIFFRAIVEDIHNAYGGHHKKIYGRFWWSHNTFLILLIPSLL